MTTEIGTKNKTIKYINIHKEGLTAEDTIDVDNRWTTPILDKQSDYLVAISRFEVPLNRVPVTAQMDNCIEIFRYNDFLDEVRDITFPVEDLFRSMSDEEKGPYQFVFLQVPAVCKLLLLHSHTHLATKGD